MIQNPNRNKITKNKNKTKQNFKKSQFTLLVYWQNETKRGLMMVEFNCKVFSYI